MRRTVSTPHLVLGIIFTGIAALWLIASATDADIHDTAPGFPLVLIGAGLIGLVATLANSRNRRRAVTESKDPADEPEEPGEPDEPGGLDEQAEPAEPADDNEPTTVLEENR